MPDPPSQQPPEDRSAPGDELAELREALAERYHIEREAGVGGMATVYLGRDLKHGRAVAVKVLHPGFAEQIGADRFLQEIRVTARLQHPHILPLYDSGQAGRFLFYVMPFVEGESLRSKLDRERQLPIADAVRIASEVADALEYAHGQGVIHRDIKPENIMLRAGHALVADFGISLALSAAGGSRITRTGIAIGTPRYMSPEQATGERELDGRTDIYSLACVAYEMLAGQPPHHAASTQAIVAQLLTGVPRPLHELRELVPPHVDEAVMVGLARLPADRFSRASDFGAALRLGSDGPRTVRAPAQKARSSGRSSVVIALGAAGVIGWGAVGWMRSTDRSVPPLPTRWLDLALPDSAPLAFPGIDWDEGTGLAISRDGRQLLYVARIGDTTRLVLRPLDQPGFRVLEATDGAHTPFFSPDGRSIGYIADGQIFKRALDGGRSVALADVRQPVGAAWRTDDQILVSDGSGLVSISAATGQRTSTQARCQDASRPCWLPQPLRNSEWVLVSSYGDIGVVSLRTGERRVVLDSLFEPQARLLPSGDIAYFQRPGQLFVIGFDPDRLVPRGAPVAVLDGVRQGSTGGQYAVADDGTLVFARGGHLIDSRFVWVDREGNEEPVSIGAESYGVFNLSPDGRRVAATVYRTTPQIWVYDLGRGTGLPIVTSGDAEHPVWSPDGREIAFALDARSRAVPPIMAVPSAGGQPRELVREGGYPFSWTRDGRVSFLRANHGPSGEDMWIADVANGTTPTNVPGPGTDDAPIFSPDGRFMAYMSGITDRWEIYVEPVPATGDQWVVSGSGGVFPRWSPDGRELFFMRDRSMYVVDLSHGPAAASPPRLLFSGDYVLTFGHAFAVAPDGDRFLMLKPTDPRRSAATLTVVQGWLAEIAARGAS